jgi:hypothetical protein
MTTPVKPVKLSLDMPQDDYVTVIGTAGLEAYNKYAENLNNLPESLRLAMLAKFVASAASGLDVQLRQLLLNNYQLCSMMANKLPLDSLNIRELRIMVDLTPNPPKGGSGKFTKAECIAYLKQTL